MVIYTAKLSKSKLAALGLVLLAVLVVLIVTISGCTKDAGTKLPDNEARVAYLQSLGWQVSAEPTETQQVLIPEEMNEVLEQYNAIQLQQGFDLNQYLGKTAMRYVYQITIYEDADGEVYVTLLLSNDRLIAADITGTANGGFVRALLQPQQSSAQDSSLSIIA